MAEQQVQVFRRELGAMESQFADALPKHIPAERFARVVMTAIQRNPELLEVERGSLWRAATEAAQDGLLPDGREGAMVVRRDFKNNRKLANWQPMIAGIRKKARNSGEIASWDAQIVRQGDHFQFQLGDAAQVNHTYDLQSERGDIIGAYSVCVLKDGTKSYEVMSIAEIHAIRDRSDAWRAYKAGKIKSTPWSTDEGEMCRKTVARRHAKMLPMSSDLDDLVRRDDALYNFEEDKAQVPAGQRPQSLVGKLDMLAGPTAEGAAEESVDPDTGEVIEGEAKPTTAKPKTAAKKTAAKKAAKKKDDAEKDPPPQNVEPQPESDESGAPSSSAEPSDTAAGEEPPQPAADASPAAPTLSAEDKDLLKRFHAKLSYGSSGGGLAKISGEFWGDGFPDEDSFLYRFVDAIYAFHQDRIADNLGPADVDNKVKELLNGR